MAEIVFRDVGAYSRTIVNTVPTRQGGILVPAIIGFGKDWFDISGEAVVRGSTLYDDPENLITRNLNKIGDSPATSDYVINTDVKVSTTGGYEGQLEWLNNTLTDPVVSSVTSAAAGGSIPADTYYFIVTAVNAHGETDKTGALVGEGNVTTTGSTSTITINWAVIPGAVSYKVWGDNNTGGSGGYTTPALIGATVNTSLTITAWSPSTGAPAASNTAYKKPVEGATYYATYDYYKAAEDYEPHFITSFADIQANYGGETINTGTYASPTYTQNDIGLAASLIFDNGATGIYVTQLNNITSSNNTLTSVSGDGEIRNAYQDALDLLKSRAVYYIIPLSTDSIVRQKAIDHVQTMSNTQERAERVCVLGFETGTAVGDASTSDSMLGIRAAINALGDVYASRAWFIGNQVGTKDVKNDDGSAQTLTMSGEFFASLFAGKQAGMASITYPVNRKPVTGLTTITPFSDANRLTLQNNGVSVLMKVGEIVIQFSRAVTAASGSTEYKEPTTRQEMDVIVADMRETLERQYIVEGNAVILTETPILVQNTVNVILRRNKDDKLIADYFPQDTKAVQNQNTPTEIDVSYKVKLVYPVINIYITQVISLS